MIEIDLAQELPVAAEAVRQASLRGEAERGRIAERRAEARRDTQNARSER